MAAILVAVIAVVASGDEAPLLEEGEGLGLDFVHGVGATGTYFLPEIIGPGCALFDYDGDGDLDAYLVNAGEQRRGAPNRMFRNDPGPRFVDVTAESGLGDPGYGMGVAVGDYDQDGDVDVYVTNYGANALYRNLGGGRFENVTAAAKVGCAGWSCSAAFVDYDLDGDLDLFVTNYLQIDPDVVCPDRTGTPEYCGPRRFPGTPDVLYRNDGGGFEDVSAATGIGATNMRGLGVVCADFAGDSRPDIFVANDNEENQLWVWDGSKFVDRAMPSAVAVNFEGRQEASMGIVCEDLDGDQRLDLFITHLRGESNTAYLNQGEGRFDDFTSRCGLLAPSMAFTGFGAVQLDLDHDGNLDLATVNGHVFRGPADPNAAVSDFWKPYAQPGQLYRNRGSGKFVDVSEHAGRFGVRAEVGRGLAVGDVDGDGAQDLLMTSIAGPARIYFNRAPARGHWLAVRATTAGRDAVGAVVRVSVGGRALIRRVDPMFSFLSASDPKAHFGLGDHTRYDSIEVIWPGGQTETFPGGEADRIISIAAGTGQ